LIRAVAALRFSGRPNRLSREHVGWEAIADVAGATRKPRTAAAAEPAPPREWAVRDPAPPAARIVRQRRSAVAMTRGPELPRRTFLAILDKTLPREGAGPFDACPEAVGVHLVLFVHAVAGLDPGLYFLARSAAGEREGRALLPDAAWEAVEPGFPLYALRPGDLRRTASLLSCGQEIAGEGVFAVGLLARFADTIAAAAYRYRRLFRECGMIGQVLYLEAEAHGLRGTGIGCFFDDAVHDFLGLPDDRWQSLYHFTVGHPIEDRRLTTLPPYSQAVEKRRLEP
jgi:nitroreductase